MSGQSLRACKMAQAGQHPGICQRVWESFDPPRHLRGFHLKDGQQGMCTAACIHQHPHGMAASPLCRQSTCSGVLWGKLGQQLAICAGVSQALTLASFERFPQHCTRPKVHVPSYVTDPFGRRPLPQSSKSCNKGCYACTPSCFTLQMQQTGASETGVRGQNNSTDYRHGARVLLSNDLRPSRDVISVCKATTGFQATSKKVLAVL